MTKVNQDIFEDKCESSSLLCRTNNYLKGIAAKQHFKEQLDSATKGVITFIVDRSATLIFSIPKRLLNLFIVFFLSFYFLVDGKVLYSGKLTLGELILNQDGTFRIGGNNDVDEIRFSDVSRYELKYKQ